MLAFGSMVGTAISDSYPLSPLQAGMLFHHLQHPSSGVDIEQMVGSLSETIDHAVMHQAWIAIAQRHDILRSAFRWDGRDAAVQDVFETIRFDMDLHDWRHESADAHQQQFEQFLLADRIRGFDLAEAPLWRLSLFQFADGDERFVFTYHHALLDLSVVWVVQEAFLLYDAIMSGQPMPQPEVRLPYRDHIMWLQQHLVENRPAAQDYFRSLLDGIQGPTSLAAIETADLAPRPNGVYGAQRFLLDVELSQGLHSLAAEQRVPLAAIVEATWGLVLAALSGSADVVFGSTRGCRRSGLPNSDNIVGLFINTPPVRLVIDPTQVVLDYVRDVRRQQSDKRAFEHTPLTDIQSALADRSAAAFESIVVIIPQHPGAQITATGPAFADRHFDFHDQTNFALTLLAYLDPQIRCKLSYDQTRFDADGISRVQQLFTQVLQAIVDDPHGQVLLLPSVPAADVARIAHWNDTKRPFPVDGLIQQLFEQQVDQTPNAVALVFGDQSLTYQMLDQRANAVSARLRSLAVQPDSLVGVFVDRSIDMVVAMLGVLKAGGAYVPIDPGYPSARIAMMLEDCGATVVVTNARLRSSIPALGATVVDIESVAEAAPRTAGDQTMHSGQLAYVIFTSGSTGRPKGVMIEHRNVVNFFTAMDEQLGHSSSSTQRTWLAVTSMSFDISVLELLWTLTRGFTVVLQPDETRLFQPTMSPALIPALPGVAAVGAGDRPVQFSLFYFAADAGGQDHDRYRLMIEGARFADQHDFSAVWTPERHFHEFGGLYPNPALTSAAIAMVTDRIAIRAGSVVLPLHNPIRCAEDWSVVDNLSNGRVGLSFASGWHANDFALAPDNFADRRRLMAEGIDTILALWAGETVPATSGDGRDISVALFPPPVQKRPPVWITAGGSPETFSMAGRMGANILTNLLVMTEADLVANIAEYRLAYQRAGHPGEGTISVMLHTFVGTNDQDVRALVRQPFIDYLRTSTDLINKVRWEQTGFAKADQQTPSSQERDLDDLSDAEMDVIMDHAFERYFRSAGLFGTVDTCLATVQRLQRIGINEIACLVDFGVDQDIVLDSLNRLDTLRQRSTAPVPGPGPGQVAMGIADHIVSHGVTHLQCTPSLASVVAADDVGLSALGMLDKLLLGGEGLPAALVDRILPALGGQLLNMYGPTETTIWSTVAPVVDVNAPITIGGPIANTQIAIVSPNLTVLPIGVYGELLIGGAGVVRGYLDRPELTADRFVSLGQLADSSDPASDRWYRTGDLARWTSTGAIELAGRLDDQVKIRGYRIELGEIETAIGQHPDVAENVVVARSTGGGDPQLVSYVVRRAPHAASSESPQVVERWGDLWDATYGASAADDRSFDLSGWADSYTGVQIPVEQMADWVDETVARIEALSPHRILEIGCGTGLLLFRLAASSDRYVGIDLSSTAVASIDQEARRQGLDQVRVVQGEAASVSDIVDETFDTVVINSVAQYFPSGSYLVDVICQAFDRLEPGGQLFLGDVRDRRLHAHFAASVELFRAAPTMLVSELAERVNQRIANDEELLIDPALFQRLPGALPSLAHVQLLVKRSIDDNEMTRFRYDVVLTKQSASDASQVGAPIRDSERLVSGAELTLDDLANVARSTVVPTRIQSVPNARLAPSAELVRQLEFMATAAAHPSSPDVSVADLRTALGAIHSSIHPADVERFFADRQTALVVSAAHPECFDVLVRSAEPGPTSTSGLSTPVISAADGEQGAAVDWSSFVNRPAQRHLDHLIPDLRSRLRDTLPQFMVPSAFVLLDALPRTPNGKIDRQALPEPDRQRQVGAAVVAPTNETEQAIVSMWQDLLSLDTVGVETNVFDLGANSLMMVKANTRLKRLLNRPVTLVEMFQFPTVRSLAQFLSGQSAAFDETLAESSDRAQHRNDAMRRRREARQGGRPGR